MIAPRTILACLAAGTTLVGAAGLQQTGSEPPPPAPLSSAHREWLEQDVVYIISPREKEVFELLASDEERDLFIETFWRVRDPTPGTMKNEAREEHDRRVAYANRYLGRETPRAGWQTDRGRTYIQLGEPRDIGRYVDPKAFWPMELWTYQANARASGLPPFFYVLFFRPEMSGEYVRYDPFIDGPARLAKQMSLQMADAREVVRTLLQEVGYEVAHASLSLNASERPDFTNAQSSGGNELLLARIGESPFVGLDVRYAEAFLAFRGDVQATVTFNAMPVGMAAMAFWDDRGFPYLHYAVQLPPERVMLASYEQDFYLSLGISLQVSDLRGDSVERGGDNLEEHFDEQRAQALIHSPLAYYDRIALVPGVYDLDVEVLNRVNEEGSLARARVSVTPPPQDGAVLGDLLLAGAAQRVDRPAPRAFQFDNVQFVPAIDGRINAGGPAYLFAQLMASGSAADGATADVSATLIDAQGAEVTTVHAMPTPLRDAPAPTSLMVTLSLDGVRPGDYTARFTVGLPGERTLSREMPVEVVVPGTVRDPMVLLAGQPASAGLAEYQTRGAQHLRKGETAAAIAWFRFALQEDPDATGVRRSLAQALSSAGDYAEAARTIAPLAQSNAATPGDVLILSVALREAGEPLGAANTARALLERWRPTPAAYNALGDALLALGQNAAAADALRSSLALDPDQPEVRAKLERISG